MLPTLNTLNSLITQYVFPVKAVYEYKNSEERSDLKNKRDGTRVMSVVALNPTGVRLVEAETCVSNGETVRQEH